MNSSPVTLVLDGNRRTYEPGETLSGHYRIDSVDDASVKSIELSVMWFSEGKGEEDLAVHFFERREPQSGQFIDLRQPRPFSTPLPQSPLSYRGLIVKIRWCVRVRVFLSADRDLTVEEPFQLGRVPPAQAIDA